MHVATTSFQGTPNNSTDTWMGTGSRLCWSLESCIWEVIFNCFWRNISSSLYGTYSLTGNTTTACSSQWKSGKISQGKFGSLKFSLHAFLIQMGKSALIFSCYFGWSEARWFCCLTPDLNFCPGTPGESSMRLENASEYQIYRLKRVYSGMVQYRTLPYQSLEPSSVWKLFFKYLLLLTLVL